MKGKAEVDLDGAFYASTCAAALLEAARGYLMQAVEAADGDRSDGDYEEALALVIDALSQMEIGTPCEVVVGYGARVRRCVVGERATKES